MCVCVRACVCMRECVCACVLTVDGSGNESVAIAQHQDRGERGRSRDCDPMQQRSETEIYTSHVVSNDLSSKQPVLSGGA